MYWEGHEGVAILTYTPIAFVLAATDHWLLLALGTLGVAVTADIPDRDLQIPGLTHRGFTHTVGFALLAGLPVGLAFIVLAQNPLLAAAGTVPPIAAAPAPLTPTTASWFLWGVATGALGVLSHIAGDVLTPAGVTPFWPLSRASYSLNLTRADNRRANRVLFVGGWLLYAAALAAGTHLSALRL